LAFFAQEVAGKIAEVPWATKGFLILNLCIALTTVPWILECQVSCNFVGDTWGYHGLPKRMWGVEGNSGDIRGYNVESPRTFDQQYGLIWIIYDIIIYYIFILYSIIIYI
jgi:hypothetical protein